VSTKHQDGCESDYHQRDVVELSRAVEAAIGKPRAQRSLRLGSCQKSLAALCCVATGLPAPIPKSVDRECVHPPSSPRPSGHTARDGQSLPRVCRPRLAAQMSVWTVTALTVAVGAMLVTRAVYAGPCPPGSTHNCFDMPSSLKL